MYTRPSEIHVKYVVIGRNVYSYLLYKMLGDNCIVVSHKQPVYIFSYDYLIPRTDRTEKFFDYYMIEHRKDKIIIGSINRNKDVLKLQEEIDRLGIPVKVNSNPATIECLRPLDIYSLKYYLDHEVEKIKIKKDYFIVYLKDYYNIIKCEKIINTMPLPDFLDLIYDLKFMKQYTKTRVYRRYTNLLDDLENPETKVIYDINIDFNPVRFTAFRKLGFNVVGDLVSTKNKKLLKSFTIEVQPYYKFEPELHRKKITNNIINIGRYAQMVNKYTFDHFYFDILEFQKDDIYSLM